jgi:hypothetical protein
LGRKNKEEAAVTTGLPCATATVIAAGVSATTTSAVGFVGADIHAGQTKMVAEIAN